MKTNKQIYDWINSQSWGKEFEGLILSTYGMNLASFIIFCNGDFGNFIHEGCNVVNKTWNDRELEFAKFYSK